MRFNSLEELERWRVDLQLLKGVDDALVGCLHRLGLEAFVDGIFLVKLHGGNQSSQLELFKSQFDLAKDKLNWIEPWHIGHVSDVVGSVLGVDGLDVFMEVNTKIVKHNRELLAFVHGE